MDTEPPCPGTLPVDEINTAVKQEQEAEHPPSLLAAEASPSTSEAASGNHSCEINKQEWNTEPRTNVNLEQTDSCSLCTKTEIDDLYSCSAPRERGTALNPASTASFEDVSQSINGNFFQGVKVEQEDLPEKSEEMIQDSSLQGDSSEGVLVNQEDLPEKSEEMIQDSSLQGDSSEGVLVNQEDLPEKSEEMIQDLGLQGDSSEGVLVKQEDLPEKSEEMRQDSEDSEEDSSTSSSSSSGSESDTEESSSSSESSSEDSSSTADENMASIQGASDSEEDCKDRLTLPPKTAKEVLIKDLSPVQPVDVILDSNEELTSVGVVSSIIGQLVVIQSSLGVEALDSNTVLFRDDKQAIGVIFEVFGPVVAPLYTVRFNSLTDIQDLKIDLKMQVFFAPRIPNITTYVFTQKLKQLKGSDASWENDEEPPTECVQYSDDEQERDAKKSKKNDKRKRKMPNPPSRNDSQDVAMATDESLPSSRNQFQSDNRHGYFESPNHQRPRGRAAYDARPRPPFQNWRGRGMPRPSFGHGPPRPPFGPPPYPQAYQHYGSSFNPDHYTGTPGNPQAPPPYGGYCFPPPPPPPPPPHPHPNIFEPPPPPPPGYPNYPNFYNPPPSPPPTSHGNNIYF